MSRKDNEIIAAIHKLLKEKFSDYRGLYFYGSRLGKRYKQDSDCDIVVTFNNKIDWKIENDVWGEIGLLELQKNIDTDVKVCQYSELQQQNTPFREAVVKTGIFYGV
jgi:hypothetical protein